MSLYYSPLGTEEERGILKWRENLQSDSMLNAASVEDVYGLSFFTKYLKKIRSCSHVPVSPTFDHESYLNCRNRQSDDINGGQNNDMVVEQDINDTMTRNRLELSV